MQVTYLIGVNNLAWDRIFSLTRPADLSTMFEPLFHGHALFPGNEEGDIENENLRIRRIRKESTSSPESGFLSTQKPKDSFVNQGSESETIEMLVIEFSASNIAILSL